MPRYSVTLQRTASTTLSLGMAQATATLPRRMKLYEFAFGSEATSADNMLLVGIRRVTAGSPSGGAAVVPQPLSTADAAAVFDAYQAATGDPTIAATYLWVRPVNQKATLQWQARPGGELISPATDNNGFAVMTPTSTAVAVTANMHIEE